METKLLNYSSRFDYELRRLIAEKLEFIKDELAYGHGVSDFPEYKRRVGQVSGLETALEFCDEAKSICDGKEREP